LLTVSFDANVAPAHRSGVIRASSLDGSTEQVVGRWEPRGLTAFSIDGSGTSLVSLQDGRLLQRPLDALSAPPRVIGTHRGEARVWMRPWRDTVVTSDAGGEVRIWDLATARLERTIKSPSDARLVALGPERRLLACAPPERAPARSLVLADLGAPRTAEPLALRSVNLGFVNALRFSPDGSWLASVSWGTVAFWNTRGPRSIVLGRQQPPLIAVAFTPDGHLLSTSDNEPLRRWSLDPAAPEGVRTLWSGDGGTGNFLEVAPGGHHAVMVQRGAGRVIVVPLDGSTPIVHQIKAPAGKSVFAASPSLDPSGRFVALAVGSAYRDLRSIHVLDLTDGSERTLDTRPSGNTGCAAPGTEAEGFGVPAWLPDGRLVSDGDAGLRVWDVSRGTSRLLRPCKKMTIDALRFSASTNSRVLRLDAADMPGVVPSVSVYDVGSGTTWEISSHGNKLVSASFDTSGSVIVTGDHEGVVRVGPVTGEAPHLLYGHTLPVRSVAVSRDGRWIASASNDGTIRLWPMPDLSKPPLHTLPLDQLLAKLRSLTNLRAVRDPASSTGWKIEVGPFPGWKEVPGW
jgi:WD40 repeat protein